MTGRILLRLSPIAAVVALAACGGGNTTVTVTTTTTTTTTAPAQTTSFRVYFLKDGKVQPVTRDVSKTVGVAFASVNALIRGPTPVEQSLGLSTSMPSEGSWYFDNGIIRFQSHTHLSRLALAQLVYTLTQFPTVKAVEVGGKRYTRADFEAETPIILVESPLPLQRVRSPRRVTGTANTFEATFNYDLTDLEGKVLATNFVTATSGSGQRGTFDFTVPFTVDHSEPGKLIVYERSAKDGSRIHVNEIPVFLEQ